MKQNKKHVPPIVHDFGDLLRLFPQRIDKCHHSIFQIAKLYRKWENIREKVK